MQQPWRYRNKAQYPLAAVGGQLVMGFFARGTHEIVEADDCLIQDPLNVEVAFLARSLLAQAGVPGYDETTGLGVIRHVVVRTSRAHRTAMAILVTNGPDLPGREEIVAGLAAHPKVVSVAQNINTRRTNVIFGEETRILWGEPHPADKIGHVRFLISPRSSFLVNGEQAAVLYEQVRRAAPCPAATARSTASAGRSRRDDAAKGIAGRVRRVGRVEDVLRRLVQQGQGIAVARRSPRLRGCEPAVRGALAAAGVARLVYVS